MQADVPFTTHAIFGIDPSSFHHMDTGRNRDANDVLSMLGVANSQKMAVTIKALLAWNKGLTRLREGVSNQEIKDAYLKRYNVELLKEGIAWAQKVYAQTRYPIGPVASTFYVAVENGRREEVENFFRAMISQVGSSTSGPIKLQQHLTMLRGNRMDITTHEYAVLLSRAFYCFINNKRMTKDMLSVKVDDKRMRMSA